MKARLYKMCAGAGTFLFATCTIAAVTMEKLNDYAIFATLAGITMMLVFSWLAFNADLEQNQKNARAMSQKNRTFEMWKQCIVGENK